MPDAEIIAIGSEMLTPQRLDTNSLFITDQLNSLGVEVRRKVVIGDDKPLLTSAIAKRSRAPNWCFFQAVWGLLKMT